jgi:hypothetical protein
LAFGGLAVFHPNWLRTSEIIKLPGATQTQGVVMHQSLARSFALLVLGFFLAAPGYAGDDKDKSPEDVFKDFAAAMKKADVKKKGDMKAVMLYLTRDSQSVIAGFMLIVACSEPSDKKGKEARKAFEDVLKRHGISSEDALRKITEDRGDRWFPSPNMMVAWGEMVKDKPAFVADVLEVAAKHLGWEKKDLPEIGEGNIKDVKIDGEQAKGERTIPGAAGKETTETVYFKLENGVWKIDLMQKMEEPSRVSPPAPPPQVRRQATPSNSRPGLLRRLLDRLRNW